MNKYTKISDSLYESLNEDEIDKPFIADILQRIVELEIKEQVELNKLIPDRLEEVKQRVYKGDKYSEYMAEGRVSGRMIDVNGNTLDFIY